MLLKEVIDTKRTRNVERFPASRTQDSKGGAQAQTFYDQKTGTIIKHAEVEDRNDPYVRFIRMIQKHDDNPFLPKIYNAKLYRRREDGEMMFWVQMEKLHSLKDESIKDAVAHQLENQLGFDLSDVDRNETGTDYDIGEFDLDNLFSLLNDSQGRQWLMKRTSNPKFAEALKFLTQVYKSKQGQPDMHADNMMARLGPTGPQLVIIDPVAPNWV